jgi:hypothetical protein
MTAMGRFGLVALLLVGGLGCKTKGAKAPTAAPGARSDIAALYVPFSIEVPAGATVENDVTERGEPVVRIKTARAVVELMGGNSTCTLLGASAEVKLIASTPITGGFVAIFEDRDGKLSTEGCYSVGDGQSVSCSLQLASRELADEAAAICRTMGPSASGAKADPGAI